MKKNKSTLLALYALFIAFVTIATMLGFPIVIGYINLGDAIIFSIALVFGPIAGFISGSIGSALADVLLGYAIWAPFTFVIKGLAGLVVGLASTTFLKTKFNNVRVITMLGLGVIIFNVGYFLAGSFLYDFPAALASAPLNLFQSIVAVVLTIPLTSILKSLPVVKK